MYRGAGRWGLWQSGEGGEKVDFKIKIIQDGCSQRSLRSRRSYGKKKGTVNSLCDEPKGHLRRRLAPWDLINFLFDSSCICTCTKTAFHKHEVAALHTVKNWVNGEHFNKIHLFTHGFHALDSGFRVLDSFSVSGTWILDSYRSGIPDSKAQNSEVPNQTFLGFRNPDSFTRGDVLLDFPYFLVGRFQAKQTQKLSRLAKQQWKPLRR